MEQFLSICLRYQFTEKKDLFSKVIDFDRFVSNIMINDEDSDDVIERKKSCKKSYKNINIENFNINDAIAYFNSRFKCVTVDNYYIDFIHISNYKLRIEYKCYGLPFSELVQRKNDLLC